MNWNFGGTYKFFNCAFVALEIEVFNFFKE